MLYINTEGKYIYIYSINREKSILKLLIHKDHYGNCLYIIIHN